MPFCGEDLTWINPGTGDWFDPSNWLDDFGHHGVPICPSPAFINNGGTAQISTPTPTANACQLFLGNNSGQYGNLIVDHGTLQTCHEMLVGYAGKGILRIQNGGLVSTFYDAAIGAIADSSGAVTVDGTNPDGRTSTWTVSGPLYVGGYVSQGGTGLLTVTNQAGVTADRVYVYKSGTLTGNGPVTTTNNGATTIEGTLAPSAGTFTFNGDVLWRDSAVTEYSFSSSSLVNKLEISGMGSLNGRLSVNVAAGTPTGRYTLVHASNLQFSFSSYSIKVPGCLGWSIVYDRENGYVYLDLAATCN